MTTENQTPTDTPPAHVAEPAAAPTVTADVTPPPAPELKIIQGGKSEKTKTMATAALLVFGVLLIGFAAARIMALKKSEAMKNV